MSINIVTRKNPSLTIDYVGPMPDHFISTAVLNIYSYISCLLNNSISTYSVIEGTS